MRFFGVIGDVPAARKGEKSLAVEPEAIFVPAPNAHHSSWLRLNEGQIHHRLGASMRGVQHDTPLLDLEQALYAIAQHREWQQRVVATRGYQVIPRKKLRKGKPDDAPSSPDAPATSSTVEDAAIAAAAA